MSNLERSRKEDYDYALTLATQGKSEAALDILWDLRLKVDLSIYRRALVNLTLAAILRRADRVKYAQECLDLLDILRQQQAGVAMDEEEVEHLKDMEDEAKQIIDTAANPTANAGDNPQRIRQDPNTGLLSEDDFDPAPSPAATVTNDMQGLSLVGEATGSPPAIDDDDDVGEVVWESQHGKPLEAIPSNLPKVEGFLRDKYYTPFAPYHPDAPSTSKANRKETRPASPEPRQLTPAISSPSRDRMQED